MASNTALHQFNDGTPLKDIMADWDDVQQIFNKQRDSFLLYE